MNPMMFGAGPLQVALSSDDDDDGDDDDSKHTAKKSTQKEKGDKGKGEEEEEEGEDKPVREDIQVRKTWTITQAKTLQIRLGQKGVHCQERVVFLVNDEPVLHLTHAEVLSILQNKSKITEAIQLSNKKKKAVTLRYPCSPDLYLMVDQYRYNINFGFRRQFVNKEGQLKPTRKGINFGRFSKEMVLNCLEGAEAALLCSFATQQDLARDVMSLFCKYKVQRIAELNRNCLGCKENQPGQEAHMGRHGCLEDWCDICDRYESIVKIQVTFTPLQDMLSRVLMKMDIDHRVGFCMNKESCPRLRAVFESEEIKDAVFAGVAKEDFLQSRYAAFLTELTRDDMQ